MRDEVKMPLFSRSTHHEVQGCNVFPVISWFSRTGLYMKPNQPSRSISGSLSSMRLLRQHCYHLYCSFFFVFHSFEARVMSFLHGSSFSFSKPAESSKSLQFSKPQSSTHCLTCKKSTSTTTTNFIPFN